MRRRVKVPKRIALRRTTRQYLLKLKISSKGLSHSLIKNHSRAGVGKSRSLGHSAVSGSKRVIKN